MPPNDFVIGCAAPLIEAVCRKVRQQSGSGEVLGWAGRGHSAGQRPDGGDEHQDVMATDRWEPRWEPHG